MSRGNSGCRFKRRRDPERIEVDDLPPPRGLLRLPRDGKDGDIYQITNASGDHFAYILTDNTTLRDAVPVSSGPHTFRFDAVRRTWLSQSQ